MRPTVALLVAAIVLVAGCGRKSSSELYTQAEETRQQAQHVIDSLAGTADVPVLYSEVIAAYEQVYNEYPASAEAEQALFKIAEIEAGIVNQPQKALATFQKFVEAFPSSQKTETAMFMVGYIYNNELNMIDSARAAYTRFLQRFPDAELSISAQYELNNLGKNPEDLLSDEPGEPDLGGAAKKR